LASLRSAHNLRRSLSANAGAQLRTQVSPDRPCQPSFACGSDPRPNPHAFLAPELDSIRKTLLLLLGSSHPQLSQIAEYYFLLPSKQLRPLIVLLFARALNGLGAHWSRKRWEAEADRGRAEELNRPLSRPDVLNDWNPRMPEHTLSFQAPFSLQDPTTPLFINPQRPPLLPSRTPALTDSILPTQSRLAQIVEMIHVASLLHDDVLDLSPLRRGKPSAPAEFGNKLSILAGDFMLGRASAALSRLGDSEVVELIAGVIANLVEGELLQLRETHAPHTIEGISTTPGALHSPSNPDRWNIYLKKTYLKTASLMAKSARASAILGGATEGEIWKDIAYAYGRNIGIAFQVSLLVTCAHSNVELSPQLVDDVLDYEAGEAVLGKPGGADLRLGLTTGPALYAWEEHSAMGPLIQRKFENEGDVEMAGPRDLFEGAPHSSLLQARDLVRRSSGVERTRALAQQYVDKAREIAVLIPSSEAREALFALADMVISRKR
jgi:hexaprenyl-diphosphate synthase